MTGQPEEQQHEPATNAETGDSSIASPDAYSSTASQSSIENAFSSGSLVEDASFAGDPVASAPVYVGADQAPVAYDPYASEPPLFHSFTLPPAPPKPPRIPHLGHLFIAIALAIIGLVVSIAFMAAGVHFHLFGVKSLLQSGTEIHYILGSEAIIYLVALFTAMLVFPAIWSKSLFAGLQWNGATALHLRGRLVGTAFVCFILAWLNGLLIPSPTNTPIEKVFRTPGAAWLLFAFGVTMAPFFEEIFFRGFLLPSLCTAYDWIAEKITGASPRPLLANGHPQWSVAAMVVASIATSLPFAAMHGDQTGYAIGPFLLLVGVSLVLCGVRLVTRSLAAGVMVHACYNFLLFSLMLIGTGGFRHLDKM
jgi:uncharacterized protein